MKVRLDLVDRQGKTKSTLLLIHIKKDLHKIADRMRNRAGAITLSPDLSIF
jgi:hypothetical protein